MFLYKGNLDLIKSDNIQLLVFNHRPALRKLEAFTLMLLGAKALRPLGLHIILCQSRGI